MRESEVNLTRPPKRQQNCFARKVEAVLLFLLDGTFSAQRESEDAASAKSNAIKQMFVKGERGKRDQIRNSLKSDLDWRRAGVGQ